MSRIELDMSPFKFGLALFAIALGGFLIGWGTRGIVETKTIARLEAERDSLEQTVYRLGGSFPKHGLIIFRGHFSGKLYPGDSAILWPDTLKTNR